MTDKQHEGLPVHGYKPQSDEKVALVNEFKQDEERLLRKLDKLAADVAITDLANGRYDPRWIAIARTEIQNAFMALNRAVFQPERIRLPEDDSDGDA